MLVFHSGRNIRTAVTPNVGLVGESPPKCPDHSGLGIIAICPDIWCFLLDDDKPKPLQNGGSLVPTRL